MIFSLSKSYSQLKDVSFQLKYEKSSNVFECYLIVNDGDAYSKKNRIQYNSQITIVTPPETELKIVESFSPLQDNAMLNGTKSTKWTIGNEVKNSSSLSEYNLHSIIPSLSPTAYYNQLDKGSSVKLFSFSVNPMPECGEGVRLYDNNKDESSANFYKGGDFSNSIFVGGLQKINTSIANTVNNALPQGETKSKYETNSMQNLTLVSGEWSNVSSYRWITPSGRVIFEKDITIHNVSIKDGGRYHLIVKSEDGCEVTKVVNVLVNDVAKEALLNVDESISSNIRDTDYSLNKNVNSFIYPNPATDHINILIKNSINKNYTIDIVNIEGELLNKNIASGKINDNEYVNQIKFNLSTGIYILQLKLADELIEHKFLVVE